MTEDYPTIGKKSKPKIGLQTKGQPHFPKLTSGGNTQLCQLDSRSNSMSAYVARKHGSTLKNGIRTRWAGLPNPDLQPEKATHFDVSFQYEIRKPGIQRFGVFYSLRCYSIGELMLKEIHTNIECGKACFGDAMQVCTCDPEKSRSDFPIPLSFKHIGPDGFMDVPKHKVWSNLSINRKLGKSKHYP